MSTTNPALEDDPPVSIKIERCKTNYLTKVIARGETLRAESFNTEAAAMMAFRFFEKAYQLNK